MKKLLLILCLLIKILPNAFTQSLDIIKNDSLLLATLKQEKFGVDSNAQAVYLYKNSSFSNWNGDLQEEEVIIKILSDEAAQDLSWVNIPKAGYSFTNGVVAETYNLEMGKVVIQKMENKDIKFQNITENINMYKFNIPSVKKGSIIHYRYKLLTHRSVFIPDWYGQENYPVIYEKYNIGTNGSLTYYNKLERFFVPFTVLKDKSGLDTCTACSYSEEHGNGFSIEWVRRNVPAFKKEPFMESEENFKEKVRLQYVNLVTDWDNYNKYYLILKEKSILSADENQFSEVFENNPFLEDQVQLLTKEAHTDLEKAKAIFKFVRDSINSKANSTEKNLKVVFKDRMGSSAQINLLLTAMLRKAGLKAEPAFLITRDKEKLNPIYQEFWRVNFFISRLTLNTNIYNLDASEKEMPFGLLQPNCYNGYTRTINNIGKEFYLYPNDITDKTVTFISIKTSDDSKEFLLKGEYKLGDYTAVAFRKAMKNDTSEIRKSIAEKLLKYGNGFELTSLDVDNLYNPDEPLKIHIKAKMELDPKIDIIYFDPFLDKIYDKNPFADTKRIYPIQMDYQEDNNYNFSLQLPKNFVLDDYSKSKIYKYNDPANISVKNLVSFDADLNLFNLNSHYISTTTTFAPTDYNRIREFYSKLIESQNEKIVLKKKN